MKYHIMSKKAMINERLGIKTDVVEYEDENGKPVQVIDDTNDKVKVKESKYPINNQKSKKTTKK